MTLECWRARVSSVSTIVTCSDDFVTVSPRETFLRDPPVQLPQCVAGIAVFISPVASVKRFSGFVPVDLCVRDFPHIPFQSVSTVLTCILRPLPPLWGDLLTLRQRGRFHTRTMSLQLSICQSRRCWTYHLQPPVVLSLILLPSRTTFRLTVATRRTSSTIGSSRKCFRSSKKPPLLGSLHTKRPLLALRFSSPSTLLWPYTALMTPFGRMFKSSSVTVEDSRLLIVP